MGKRGMGICAGLAAAILSLALATSAFAGQIIYTHGGDLWAMNDNGTGAHLLLKATTVGGQIGPDAAFPSYTGLSVQPNGNAIAFDAAVPAAGCTGSCKSELDPGLYTLIGNKVTRLTATPTICGAQYEDCESSETDPAITSTGKLVYLSQSALLTNGCVSACSATETSSILAEPLAGGTPSSWPDPSDCAFENGTNMSWCPQFPLQGTIASNPADAAELAYTGRQDGIPETCGATGNSYCNPIDIDETSSTPTINQPSLDDSPWYSSLSFSQNGTLIADVETGNNPGIWVYPASQSWQDQSAVYVYALADAGTGSQAVGTAAFVGSGELVFSADDNLYTISSACFSLTAGDTAQCTFNPADPSANPNVHQLTTDGTASAPDADPVWTDSTTTIDGPDTPGKSCCNPPPPAKLSVTLSASASQKVVKQEALIATLKCSLACAVVVGGGIKIKGSSKSLTVTPASGNLAANRSYKVTLTLPRSALSKLKKALKKHKHVTAAIEVVAKDPAGTQVKSVKQFTVKH